MIKTTVSLTAAALLGGAPALAQSRADGPPTAMMDHDASDHSLRDQGAAPHENSTRHDHVGRSGDGAFHHRFEDAERWAKQFDRPDRDEWQKPDQVLDALKLQPDMVVADIGAGTGYFSTRLAKRLPQGKVFATDIEKDMVRYLAERAQKESLANITPVQAAADRANLPEPVDVIVLVDAYHHIGNRVDYFRKLKDSLKSHARLVIIDWRSDTPDGPPKEHRIPLERASAELEDAGFERVETQDFLPRQYFAVFKVMGE